MVKVKICGITRAEDAEAAFSLGADYLGLIFAPSPRKVDKERAKQIMEAVPTFNQFVGVFQNEPLQTVLSTVDDLGLGFVQLHGGESADYCRALSAAGISVIKAIPVKGVVRKDMLEPYPVFAFLFDAHLEGRSGGTGKTFSWSLIEPTVWRTFRGFVSGGLTPENIDAAIDATHPYGVDASSGVEKSPGVKEHLRLGAMIQHVRQKVN